MTGTSGKLLRSITRCGWTNQNSRYILHFDVVKQHCKHLSRNFMLSQDRFLRHLSHLVGRQRKPVMSAQMPTKMTRAKEWSPEAEEAWRFQVAGYRDAYDYESDKSLTTIQRWPDNGYVKKLQRKDGYWYYYNKTRELLDKDIPKCKLYVY